MYYPKRTTYRCQICGEPSLFDEYECPKCKRAAEMPRANIARGEIRPYWDNASHDGNPAGFKIVGGIYDGMIVKAVQDR